MLIDNFNRTIDFYIDELRKYDFEALCAKPSPDSWSLGQMYLHLIEDCDYYIDQMEICVATNDNYDKQSSSNAKAMFRNNAFPDERIEGAPSNALIPQPEDKTQLFYRLAELKSRMNKVVESALVTRYKGKTKHPGLDYFSANEWLQFADMHFRHHLRQKKKLDEYLEI